MNVIVTIPFIDREGRKRRRQILMRGAEIPDDAEFTIDMRDDDHQVWTPLTLIAGADVELRAE